MPAFDEYSDPSDVLGYGRLMQAEERNELTAQRYAQMAEQQRRNNQLAAIRMSLNMGGLRGGEVQDFRDQVYDMATGGIGMKQGATYHNSLLDQSQFWDKRNANAQADYDAKQQQADPVFQDMFRQAAAADAMQRKRKAIMDELKGYESTFGFNPGIAMQDFDPKTGVGYDAATGMVHSQGKSVFNRDTGEWEQAPATRFPLPMQGRQRIQNLYAQQWGYDDFGSMNQREQQERARAMPQPQQEAPEISAMRAEMQALQAKRRQEELDPVEQLRQRQSAQRAAAEMRVFQDMARVNSIR